MFIEKLATASSSIGFESKFSMKAANVPFHVPSSRELDSMSPMLDSSAQSPCFSGDPVRSLEAATSAPVASAIERTKSIPVSPSATRQPYSRMSPVSLKAAPMVDNRA